MVVSLYICEIPKNITNKDLENIFCELEGYITTRMKGVDNRRIAFVDYESERDAKFAMDTLQGFKFSPEDERGIHIKYSDNTKTGSAQSKNTHTDNRVLSKKRKNSNSNNSYEYDHRNDRERGRSSHNYQHERSEKSSNFRDLKSIPSSTNNVNTVDSMNNLTNMNPLIQPQPNANLLDIISALSNPNPNSNINNKISSQSMNMSSLTGMSNLNTLGKEMK